MAEEVRFHPLNATECQILQAPGIGPSHKDYSCGACGQFTNGRIVASLRREIDGATAWFCHCSCPRRESAIIIERGGNVVAQIPEAREFQPGDKWPEDLRRLFEEAALSFGAGAYTAVALVCRKLLMACACQEGDVDGKTFASYVDYITTTVLAFPKAKGAIDKIRNIGNDANHRVYFVARDDAHRALSIVTYMLHTIYSLPSG